MTFLNAREGYDLVAAHYKDTKWQHLWGQVEKPFVVRWLAQLTKGVGIDIGSGIGSYIPEMITQQQKVVALDTSPEMLAQNKSNNKNFAGDVSYVVGDIESGLSFNDSFFDWAMCTRVLSNIENLGSALDEISRLVKKGGRVLITDIHPEHPYDHTAFEIPNSAFSSTLPSSEKIKIETHKHSISALIQEVEEHGFTVDFLETLTTRDIKVHLDRNKFEKLYTSLDEKILYVLQITKRVQTSHAFSA